MISELRTEFAKWLFSGATGVACGWLYQYGRALHFHIPKSVIQIGTAEIGLAACLLLPCLIAGAAASVAETARWGKRIAFAVLLVSATGVVVVTRTPGADEVAIAMGAGLIGYAAIGSFGRAPDAAMVVVGCIGLLAGVLGWMRASTQREFWVIRSDDNTAGATNGPDRCDAALIAIALYGDRLVLAPLSSDCKIEPRLVLRTWGKQDLNAARWEWSDSPPVVKGPTPIAEVRAERAKGGNALGMLDAAK